MRMVFFGVWSPRELGHAFYSPGGLVFYEWGPFTAGELDEVFTHRDRPPRFYINDLGQPEEPLTITQYSRNREPFTIIGCWDRSADSRMNSKAAFIAEGFHDKDTMVREASIQYPAITARLKSFQHGATRGWEGTVNQH